MNDVSSQALLCQSCKKGYASCECVPEYATEAQRKARGAEIRRTSVAIEKQIASRVVQAEPRERVRLSLPSDCVAVLTAWGKRWHKPVSATLRLLLSRYTASDAKLTWRGLPVELDANISAAWAGRLRTQAVHHKTTPSALVAEHLARELACED